MTIKCPYCKEKISRVSVERMPDMGTNDDDIPNDRYLVAGCPNCEFALSIILNPERGGQYLEQTQ